MNKFNALILSVMMLLSSASMVVVASEGKEIPSNPSAGVVSTIKNVITSATTGTVCWPSALLNKVFGQDKFGTKANISGWALLVAAAGVGYKLYSNAKKAELRKKQRELLEMLMAEFDEAIRAEQEAKDAAEQVEAAE